MAENRGKVFSSAHHSKNSGTTLLPLEHARYFILRLTNPTVPNTSFTKVSPFLIHKALLSVLGEVASVKKLRSGDLLVEVSEKQAAILSTCEKICSFTVTISPHKTLNTSRGVISQSEFLDDEEETVAEELKEQHVTAVRRIKIRRDGKLIPTKHLILTFDTPKLPYSVKLAWHNCPIRPYVPNPLRCFQCQRFGHSKTSCRSKPICAHCSGFDHSDTSCELPALCSNCNGAHAAYSRNCPKWSQEKEIQSVKVLQNVTFSEARRIVTARTPRPGVSYSAATKISYNSVSTQTDNLPTPPSQPKNQKIPIPLTQSSKKPIFNFTGPSAPRRPVSTSPPPTKASRTDFSVKPRPDFTQRSKSKLPPSEKPGLTRKKKNPKFNQYSNQSASAIAQKADDILTLHPSEDESLFDELPMDDAPPSTSTSTSKKKK
nr:uncharacterized protein LOC122272238 [Parasteatoda tepidariorum]